MFGQMPKALALREKKGVKLDWRTLGAALYDDGRVLGLTCIENGPVKMITIIRKVGPDHTVERLQKRSGIRFMNGKRVRKVFGVYTTKHLVIPHIIDKYNFKMGGVDLADQLRATYTYHMASWRT